MKTVHQHPDGNIFVRIDGEVYVDTPANFKSDFGVDDWPALPDGFEERIYDQGRRHLVQGKDELGGAKIEGQEMPWPLGDQIIGKFQVALMAQKARQTKDE